MSASVSSVTYPIVDTGQVNTYNTTGTISAPTPNQLFLQNSGG